MSGGKNNNVSFLSQGDFFISAGSPGLSRSARTFGYVSISLSVPVSVIQVSACAPHSPLCTPAHPSGPLLYVLRRGHGVCVCVAPPLTLVDCSVVTTCVLSQTVYYTKHVLHKLTSSNAHITGPGMQSSHSASGLGG